MAYNNRGNAYARKGDLDRAIQDHDQAIQLDPKYARAYNNRGNAYAEKGEPARAIQDFDKAIELKPDDAEVWDSKGTALLDLGKKKEALAAYEQAVRLKGGDHRFRYNLGVAQHRLGQRDKAVESFEQALRLDPSFKEVKDTLNRLKGEERVSWWEWWFAIPPSSRPRRIAGNVIISMLALYLLFPLLGGRLVLIQDRLVLNTGQDWRYYVVPVVALVFLLILPSIRRIFVPGGGGADFGPSEFVREESHRYPHDAD